MNEPLYEDRIVRASLADDAATHGHILVQPQRPIARLSDLSPEESGHLFLVASYAAAILFQGLRAEGTNIIINEEEERLTAHVVARRSDDGLSFTWQPAKLDQAAMDEAAERIKDQAFPVGKRGKAEQPTEEPKKEPDEPPPEPTKDDTISQAEKEENYLVKQLIRIP
jgi:diadenosine tetraphosphate (Ap4A) HIT family hydrolase